MNEARSKLIVALDLPDRAAALAAVDGLSGHVGFFKLGLEIFVREGPALVQQIVDRGEKVFLDLKLHDIPNTVAGAVRSACRLKVAMLTLHASGGIRMLEAAREAAESSSSAPLLLAVTALTSLTTDDARRMGVQVRIAEWVERLGDLASQAGVGGLVASTLEVPTLRRKFGDTMRLVIPGIRPAGSPSQDQARAASPAEAIRAGADFLVVGRPILHAPEPALAADRIVEEVSFALQADEKP